MPNTSTMVAVTVPVLVRRIQSAPVRDGTQNLLPPIAILTARVIDSPR